MADPDQGIPGLLRRVLDKGEAGEAVVSGDSWGGPPDTAWNASVSPSFGLDGAVVGAVVKLERVRDTVDGSAEATSGGESARQPRGSPVGLGKLRSFLDSVVENVPAMIFVKD